jgi:hypothetical protein
MQVDFFTAFKEMHHDVSIELIAFSCLKPWFVKHIKDWKTGCYHYYTKLMELKVDFNNMCSKTRGIHANCACSCVAQQMFKMSPNGVLVKSHFQA